MQSSAVTAPPGWTLYRVLGALVCGWLATLLNAFPVHFSFPPHDISLNFGIALPLLASIAWGWRYGLLAAMLGLGGLFTWWVWPENGWANVVITLTTTGWFCWHGWCAERRQRQPRFLGGIYGAEAIFAMVGVAALLLLFRPAFALNPPFWYPEANTVMSLADTQAIAVKSVISGFIAIFVVDLLLNIAPMRRLLGLQELTAARTGTMLISAGMVLAVGVILVESAASWWFFQAQSRGFWTTLLFHQEPYRHFIHLLLLLLCLGGGLVATRYLRMQLAAEQSLLEREEDLRTTLDSIGDGVIATDAQGLITRLNPVAEYLTGWPQQEAQGRPLTEVFRIINAQTRRACENPAHKVLTQGCVVGLANHTLLLAKDGRERQIADSGAPIRNAHGDIRGLVLVFRDVTDTYRLDERLRQAEKMESLGLLAGGVAHDFNNMLGGIMGYAELVAAKLVADHPCRRQVEGIINAAERASDLTVKLLAFSRKGRVVSQVFDLHQCLAESLDLLEPSLDRVVKVNRYFQAQRSWVSGDQTRLQNAFLNLGLNARDAMVDGGTLSVSTEDVDLDEDDTRLRQLGLVPGPYIAVTVSDTGCGMPPEVLERVFEPFFTTKGLGKGTGLGLAAVYGTITDNHGTVTIHSEQGKGTTISMLLPLSDEQSEQSELRAVPDPRAGTVVLLAEDDAALRDIAAQHLSALGYEVLSAVDGEQAVEIYREQQQRIQAVILDMVMPKMNGHDAFTNIRAINPGARVLLCSGYTAGMDIDDLLQQGLCGFVAKPYRRQQLARALSDALRAPHGS